MFDHKNYLQLHQKELYIYLLSYNLNREFSMNSNEDSQISGIDPPESGESSQGTVLLKKLKLMIIITNN